MLSSPENTGGFPILVSMIPRPAGVVGGGTSGSTGVSTGGQEVFCSQPLDLLQIVALLCSQSSDFVEECLHHFPLLSCHVHDSPSTRFHLPKQRVCSQRSTDMDDMWMKRDAKDKCDKTRNLSHADARTVEGCAVTQRCRQNWNSWHSMNTQLRSVSQTLRSPSVSVVH